MDAADKQWGDGDEEPEDFMTADELVKGAVNIMADHGIDSPQLRDYIDKHRESHREALIFARIIRFAQQLPDDLTHPEEDV